MGEGGGREVSEEETFSSFISTPAKWEHIPTTTITGMIERDCPAGSFMTARTRSKGLDQS